jgi:hypothetical protein
MDSGICISLRAVCCRAVRSGASGRHDRPALLERRATARPLPFVPQGERSGAGYKGVTAQTADREIGVPGETKNEGLAARAFGPSLPFVAQGKRSEAGYEGVTAQTANREISVPGKTKNEAETKNEN